MTQSFGDSTLTVTGELATGRELLAEASSASRSHKMTASNGSLNRLNVKELIKQGNLTALEDIVLQGNGDRLLGETSSAPLVQEFLDNLPTYLVRHFSVIEIISMNTV